MLIFKVCYFFAISQHFFFLSYPLKSTKLSEINTKGSRLIVRGGVKRQIGPVGDTVSLYVVRVLSALLRVLPFELAILLARLFVALILTAIRRSKFVARRNLELVFPDASFPEREKIRKSANICLAHNLVLFAKIPRLNEKRARALFDFSEATPVYNNLKDSNPGKSVIIATLHMGPFEGLVQAHSILNRPTSILARGFGYPRLDAWWYKQRERYGCEVFFRFGAFSEIEARLRKGTDVAMLVDQNVKANHAVFSKFLGITASTTKTVALGAIRSGAKVLVTAAVRNDASLVKRGSARYKVIARELEFQPGEKESVEAAVQRFTDKLNLMLGDIVLAYPEDWFWIHRRFKTRPAGEPENIYD